MNDNTKLELGLYLHIPFCVKKCDYCDFLSAPATIEEKKGYINALLTEIRSYQGRTADYIVPTIFFGGGTPSCLEAEEIGRVMMALNEVFCIDHTQLEATIEVNPGTITKSKLLEYKKAGINRLSFGLQSTQDTELKKLGRIHCYQDFLENFILAREIGFHNINVDLMSALPGQTVETWENTLHTIAALSPEHISAYSLIIEEGTGFYERYREGTPGAKELPEEETDRLMYVRTKELLMQYGYERYEISNYAKKGRECRHNNSYWIGIEYLGLGVGACSLLRNTRYSNIQDINQYEALCNTYLDTRNQLNTAMKEDKDISAINRDPIGIHREVSLLSKEQRMEEFMFLGLRRCEGISKRDFLQRFSIPIEEIYSECLTQLMDKKLISASEDRISLTDYGIDISNYVLSFFLLNE